jgi:ring-1,2-phenylacetyl-CoA epoxidase subunit PaaE
VTSPETATERADGQPRVVITKPTRRRPAFHPLRVAAVEPLTEDAVAVAFEVPVALRAIFAFQAGQHLTVRRELAGEEVRRSYSICSVPESLADRGVLRVGVRRVPGGAFSGFAVGDLRPGDTVEVLPPLGHFTTDFAADRSRHYAAIAAGSGITPVLSLAGTALAVEPASRFTLLYGNRYARSVMFADELADLKDRYPSRLHLVHVLSREPSDSALLSGRLSATRLRAIFEAGLVDRDSVDEWFLCGPYGLVTDAREVLGGVPVPVHTELFHVEDSPVPGRPAQPEAAAARTVELSLILDGRTSTVAMDPGDRVLDAARKVRPEVPFACTGGVCATCRARLVDGRVEMARNYALEPDELAAGYVLTCQSRPLTARVKVDYDA